MIRIDEETGPRRRHRHRRQRPVREARPVHGRAAGAGRVVPQRRRHRRQAARRLRLPELRFARGPGRHVAVRRGHPRPRGRLPGAGHPGHRRQRLALQPDRRGGDPPDAGGRRARRDRRRRAGARRSPSRRRASCSTCWATPARSSAARPGRRSSTSTSAGCRRRSTWSASGCSAEILISASRDGMIDAAHDLSDGGLIQAVAESCLRGGKGARLVVPDGPGRVHLPLLRVGGPRGRRRAAQRGAPLHRHVRGAGPARRPDRCRGRRRRSRSRASSALPLSELRDGARGDDPGAAGVGRRRNAHACEGPVRDPGRAFARAGFDGSWAWNGGAGTWKYRWEYASSAAAGGARELPQ